MSNSDLLLEYIPAQQSSEPTSQAASASPVDTPVPNAVSSAIQSQPSFPPVPRLPVDNAVALPPPTTTFDDPHPREPSPHRQAGPSADTSNPSNNPLLAAILTLNETMKGVKESVDGVKGSMKESIDGVKETLNSHGKKFDVLIKDAVKGGSRRGPFGDTSHS